MATSQNIGNKHTLNVDVGQCATVRDDNHDSLSFSSVAIQIFPEN